MEAETLILIVPAPECQYGIPIAMQTMIRRYFQQRFRHSEVVEVLFSSRSRCFVRITKVIPDTTPEGIPTSRFIEHCEWYDIQPGWGNEVMEVPA